MVNSRIQEHISNVVGSKGVTTTSGKGTGTPVLSIPKTVYTSVPREITNIPKNTPPTTTPVVVFATPSPIAYAPSGGGGGGGGSEEKSMQPGATDTKVEFFKTTTGKVTLAFTGLLILIGGFIAYKKYSKA